MITVDMHKGRCGTRQRGRHGGRCDDDVQCGRYVRVAPIFVTPSDYKVIPATFLFGFIWEIRDQNTTSTLSSNGYLSPLSLIKVALYCIQRSFLLSEKFFFIGFHGISVNCCSFSALRTENTKRHFPGTDALQVNRAFLRTLSHL